MVARHNLNSFPMTLTPLRFGHLPWTAQDSRAFKKAVRSQEVIFVDVDTQNDFMRPSKTPRQGLYIRQAEQIIPNLKRLVALAQQYGFPLIATKDTHRPDDPEFKLFQAVSDRHCVKGSYGWRKIPETSPQKSPSVIQASPSRDDVPGEKQLRRLLHEGRSIQIEKNTYSVFLHAKKQGKGVVFEDNLKAIQLFEQLKSQYRLLDSRYRLMMA